MENIKQQAVKLLNFPTDIAGLKKQKKHLENPHRQLTWKSGQNHIREGEKELLLIRGRILLKWLFWGIRMVSTALSSSYYGMLVQNNYLLAQNDRTLTLQTYWIIIACLPGHVGGYSLCLRRTIYYERWVKKASSLIAHRKPLSQHREGIGREWTDKTTLISITQGQDTIYITWSHRTEGNQPWESAAAPGGAGINSRAALWASCICCSWPLAWEGSNWLVWSVIM